MGVTETAIIYSIIGAVVAAGFQLADGHSGRPLAQAGLFGVRAVCWPFFAPLLLGGRGSEKPSAAEAGAEAGEAASARVDAAEARMLEALESLDGVAGDLVEPQRRRIAQLCDSLRAMDGRLGEMEALLSTPEFDEARAEEMLDSLSDGDGEVAEERAESVRARLRNIRRLKKMRARLQADFERAILKADEISSQMRLLRFADHPEREAGELVDDIAATIDGLSEGLIRP